MEWNSVFEHVNGRAKTLIGAFRIRAVGNAPNADDTEPADGTLIRASQTMEPGEPSTPTSSNSRISADETIATSRPAPKVEVKRRLTGTPLTLMTLPPELQVLIIRHLDFGDMQRLRQACRFYHTFVSKSLIKDIFGKELKYILLSHCSRCLAWDQTRVNLLCAELRNPRYPFCSTCVDCAVKSEELMVGKRVTLGNYQSAWVCRWCGYPVQTHAGLGGQSHFHKRCYTRYCIALTVYAVLGWTQFCLVVVGCALCLKYFKSDKCVLGACVAGLIVSFWPLILIDLRNPATRRTYHWSLLLELILLGLWTVPTYFIAKTIETRTVPPRTTTVTLSFCGLNIFFRFLNSLGNLILLCEYKLWRQNKPNVYLLKKIWHYLVAGLIYWTFPRVVEQCYPPRW